MLARRLLTTAPICAALLATSAGARAETYQVGPGKPYAQLQEIEDLLEPGDVVEVDGDATYPGNIHIRSSSSGTPDQKVTIRGIRVNKKRPVLAGGDDFTIVLNASHIVFEGFEVTGGPSFCIVHKGNDVTIRDTIVHDCPGHGILGTDFESGSLLLEYVEVYSCGNGLYDHQIYIATDETMYPGSVFRMQHCYVHDANGGNSVKSRAERNEIHYNWIEGALYHELDLIGPDGQDPGLAREDSDVVGNVLRKKSEWTIARIGGDGTGATGGRYRFVNNTMILASDTSNALYLQEDVESLDVHNNVVFQQGGASAKLYDDDDAVWVTGAPVIAGSNNWVQTGIGNVPTSWTGTLNGDDPHFVDLASLDFQLTMDSPLVDAGGTPVGPLGHEVPNALVAPAFVPPLHTLNLVDQASPRARVGPIDIGAYEFGSEVGTGSGGSSGPTGGSSSGPSGGSGATSGGGAGLKSDGDGASDDDGGCLCGMGRASGPGTKAAIVALALALALARRKKNRQARGSYRAG